MRLKRVEEGLGNTTIETPSEQRINKSSTNTGIAINSIFKSEHVTQRKLKIYARMSSELSNSFFFEQMVLNTSNVRAK